MGQSSSKMLISPVCEENLSSLAVLEVFIILRGGFGSYFRVIPLSTYSNPKKFGCGDNKRPFNRA